MSRKRKRRQLTVGDFKLQLNVATLWIFNVSVYHALLSVISYTYRTMFCCRILR